MNKIWFLIWYNVADNGSKSSVEFSIQAKYKHEAISIAKEHLLLHNFNGDEEKMNKALDKFEKFDILDVSTAKVLRYDIRGLT